MGELRTLQISPRSRLLNPIFLTSADRLKFRSNLDMCAFFLWEHDDAYFARSDIKAALEELAAKARSYPKQPCKK